MPNKPATIIFNIIATAIKIDKSNFTKPKLNYYPAIIAKIIPFKIPITNSLLTILKKLPDEISFLQ